MPTTMMLDREKEVDSGIVDDPRAMQGASHRHACSVTDDESQSHSARWAADEDEMRCGMQTIPHLAQQASKQCQKHKLSRERTDMAAPLCGRTVCAFPDQRGQDGQKVAEAGLTGDPRSAGSVRWLGRVSPRTTMFSRHFSWPRTLTRSPHSVCVSTRAVQHMASRGGFFEFFIILSALAEGSTSFFARMRISGEARRRLSGGWRAEQCVAGMTKYTRISCARAYVPGQSTLQPRAPLSGVVRANQVDRLTRRLHDSGGLLGRC